MGSREIYFRYRQSSLIVFGLVTSSFLMRGTSLASTASSSAASNEGHNVQKGAALIEQTMAIYMYISGRHGKKNCGASGNIIMVVLSY
jgi:hypothetical protein